MAWVKLDENFAQHPKVAQAGPLGLALHVAALCYCNLHLTDGFVPKQIAKRLLDFDGLGMRMWDGDHFGGGVDASWELVVEDLEAAGMWHPADGGWHLHDYLDYQPSRQQIQELKQARSDAGRKGGQARGKQPAKQEPSKSLSKSLSKSPGKTEAKSKPDTDTDTDIPPSEDAGASHNGTSLEECWAKGPAVLVAKGIPSKQARTVLGKWLRDHDADRVLEGIEALYDSPTQDPVPYVEAILIGQTKSKRARSDADLEAVFARLDEKERTNAGA